MNRDKGAAHGQDPDADMPAVRPSVDAAQAQGLRLPEVPQSEVERAPFTYSWAHMRLGSVTGRQCIDCGGPAEQWSLQKNVSRRNLYRDNRGVFSCRAEDYAPRCRQCHGRYDSGVGPGDPLLEVAASEGMEPNDLKQSRRALGPTQLELSALLRVDPMTVSRWERGRFRVPEAVALALRSLRAKGKKS